MCGLKANLKNPKKILIFLNTDQKNKTKFIN